MGVLEWWKSDPAFGERNAKSSGSAAIPSPSRGEGQGEGRPSITPLLQCCLGQRAAKKWQPSDSMSKSNVLSFLYAQHACARSPPTA